MKWFRQMLQVSASKIQIVVFTCRPEDHLDETTKRAMGVGREKINGYGRSTCRGLGRFRGDGLRRP